MLGMLVGEQPLLLLGESERIARSNQDGCGLGGSYGSGPRAGMQRLDHQAVAALTATRLSTLGYLPVG